MPTTIVRPRVASVAELDPNKWSMIGNTKSKTLDSSIHSAKTMRTICRRVIVIGRCNDEAESQAHTHTALRASILSSWSGTRTASG